MIWCSEVIMLVCEHGSEATRYIWPRATSVMLHASKLQSLASHGVKDYTGTRARCPCTQHSYTIRTASSAHSETQVVARRNPPPTPRTQELTAAGFNPQNISVGPNQADTHYCAWTAPEHQARQHQLTNHTTIINTTSTHNRHKNYQQHEHHGEGRRCRSRKNQAVPHRAQDRQHQSRKLSQPHKPPQRPPPPTSPTYPRHLHLHHSRCTRARCSTPPRKPIAARTHAPKKKKRT